MQIFIPEIKSQIWLELEKLGINLATKTRRFSQDIEFSLKAFRSERWSAIHDDIKAGLKKLATQIKEAYPTNTFVVLTQDVKSYEKCIDKDRKVVLTITVEFADADPIQQPELKQKLLPFAL
jgi:hypothetical protein